jgi:transcriptional regulator with XRE-family HTH domain
LERTHPEFHHAIILRGARTLLGLRQKELAKASGIGSQTIARIETGQSIPRYGTWFALTKALELYGLEIHELTDREVRFAFDTQILSGFERQRFQKRQMHKTDDPGTGP